MTASFRQRALLLGCSLVLLSVAPAAAGKAGHVDPFYGTFQDSIPIELPTYRGLEPKLELAYVSNGGNGHVGMGWSLSGFSVIERASAKRGAPDYGANDIFLVDGQELVPCAPGSVSPSCTTGGTHSTKIENFARIKRDTTANKWIVTYADGTKVTYSHLIAGPAGTTFRWGISEITNASGPGFNQVQYFWSCYTADRECYPSAVSYNGTSIAIYRELRPDVITYAIGAGLMGKTQYRLRAIDVSITGPRARVYQINYTQSAATGRSLIANVQLFGKDAIIDATGTVTSGTSLPAMVMTNEAALWPAGSTYGNSFDYARNWGPYDTVNSWSSTFMGDANGDGKADLIYLDNPTSNGYRVMLANAAGNAFLAPQNWGAYDAINAWTQFWVRDMNGDGKVDLLYLDDAYGTNGYRVMLSTGTSFAAPTNWGAYDAVANWQSVTVDDVNLDGKADLVYLKSAALGYRVMLSTGTSFQATQNWGAYDAINSWDQFWVRDVNGDGRPDLVYLDDAYTTNGYRVMLNTGTSFATPTNWGAYDTVQTWSVFAVDDANADGKADLIYLDNPTSNGYRVMLSTGSSFLAPQNWGAYDAPVQWLVWIKDMNGDGRADIFYLDDQCSAGCATGNGYKTMLSTGTSFAAPTVWGDYFAPVDKVDSWSSTWLNDVSGDGKPDVVYLAQGATTYYVKANRSVSDLLVKRTNGLGATTNITYTASSWWSNTNNPPVVHTVSYVSVYDGRGTPGNYNRYTYSGGLFDPVDRRFLGFAYMKETDACNSGEALCPYTETWFAQDYGSLSRPTRIDHRDGAGTLFFTKIHEYTTNGATVPYTSFNTGTWEYGYDGTGAACPNPWNQYTVCAYGRRSYTSRQADAYGNLIQEIHYGDWDVTGDEFIAQNIFVPNTTAFILGKQAVNRIWSGTSAVGQPLEESLVHYDGASTWNAMPTLGRATKVRRMASTAPSYLEVNHEYDAWGNRTAEVDAASRRTEYLFDATYHKFVTEKRNPKYFGAAGEPADTRHRILYGFDPVCGTQTSTTSISGLTITYQFDALCRETRWDDNAGRYENTTYANLGVISQFNQGVPTAQYIEKSGPGSSGNGDMWERTYFDGLATTYRAEQRGSTVGQEIRVDTTFDARRNVASTSLPYFANATPVWTTFKVDALNRSIRVTRPDGAYSTTAYKLGEVTSTDELGRQTKKTTDMLGRMTQSVEYNGSTPLTTTYQYNTRGQPTSITDPFGNVLTNTYAITGLRSAMVSPDRGTTTYTYDVIGQLATSTNALAQKISYTYDLLGRKTSETHTRQDLTVEKVITWRYDEERTGYYNIGALTSMTDPSGTVTLDWDRGGHLVKASRTVDSTTYTIQHGYDTADKLLWTTYPDGDTLGTTTTPRTYDATGQPASLPGYVTAMTYNAVGQPLSRTNANGTTTTYSYGTNLSRLSSIATTAGATTIQNLGYTYDTMGQVTQVTSPFANEGWTYGYNDRGWLTSATNTSSPTYNQTFTYGDGGNITSNSRLGSYTYTPAGSPRPHAVTAAGANSYAYDAAGNMISGAGRTFTWNVAGLPLSVGNESYVYDGNGERLKKTVGGVTTTYLGDDYEITAGVVTKYITLNGLPVAKKVGSTKHWLHTDHQGSIQAVTDGSGVEIQRRKYRPYGDKLSDSTSHVESRGYTMQRTDASGLVYLHARYFDPVLARFVSADPVVPSTDLVSLNPYVYAGNDAVNNTDTTGLWSLSSIWKKIKNTIKNIVTGIINVVKAALHGDIYAIMTLFIIVATIYVGGAVLTSVMAPLAPAGAVGLTALQIAMTSVTAGLVYVGVSAAIGFASSFLITYVQTGNFRASLRAGIIGFFGGAVQSFLNIGIGKWFQNLENYQGSNWFKRGIKWLQQKSNNLGKAEAAGFQSTGTTNRFFKWVQKMWGDRSGGYTMQNNVYAQLFHDPMMVLFDHLGPLKYVGSVIMVPTAIFGSAVFEAATFHFAVQLFFSNGNGSLTKAVTMPSALPYTYWALPEAQRPFYASQLKIGF